MCCKNAQIILIQSCELKEYFLQWYTGNYFSGIMVFEALCPEYDFSDETIQKIVGIFETNAIEIRMAQSSDVMALYETACLLEHSCIPNLHITFDKKFNVSNFLKWDQLITITLNFL